MSRKPLKPNMRDDRGQSLVEFALTLPMLLVVMFMVTEFGRALYQYNVMAQATREGARVAVVSGSGAAADSGEARMSTFMQDVGGDFQDLVVDIEILPNFGGDGQTAVRATADMPFRWILQGDMPTNHEGGASVSPNAFNLHAETVMRAETF
jgi:Flp pilus assembly protein TadG